MTFFDKKLYNTCPEEENIVPLDLEWEGENHMWYWVVMAVLVIGCIALLSGTFFSIKKNKAEEAAERAEARKKKRKSQGNAEEAQQPGERRKRADGGRQSSQGAENGRQQDAQARREEARRVQAEQRKERKNAASGK